MLNYLKNKWTQVKAWFKNSLTIFAARALVLLGVVYGGLEAVDWNQMIALNFADGISKTEALEMAKLIGIGVMFELTRRRSLKA